MVPDREPRSKIFTVGLSYWRISKETYYGLPTRRVQYDLWTPSPFVKRGVLVIDLGWKGSRLKSWKVLPQRVPFQKTSLPRF